MSIFAKFIEDKSLLFYIIGAVIFGFLLIFFYQTMVESNFIKFEATYNFYPTEKTDRFYLLTGWGNRRDKDFYVSMEEKRATLIFYTPQKDGLVLNFILRFHNPDQVIEVYCREHHLGNLKAEKTGVWLKKSLILPVELTKEGLNKLVFIKKRINSKPDFKKLTVKNYKNRNLVFMRAYTIWETTRWFAKRGNKPVNWELCLWGGIGFLSLWLLYSIAFFSITDKRLVAIIKSDFWTYLPAISIFSILYLISKIISTYTFFWYELDFWLILISSISIGKIYQVVKYGRKDKFKLRMRQLRDNTLGRYNLYADIFIGTFAILLLVCAILLILDMKIISEQLANWAFLFVVIGLILKLIKFFKEKEYLKEE